MSKNKHDQPKCTQKDGRWQRTEECGRVKFISDEEYLQYCTTNKIKIIIFKYTKLD